MVKDINLVVSLSDQLFQLVHFGVIAQVTAVEDSIDCRSSIVEETKKWTRIFPKTLTAKQGNLNMNRES